MSFKSDIDITDMENNVSDTNILVSKERYEELLDRELLLDSLEEYGVDNWDGWDDAISSYHLKKGEL
jgi:hypothetical protein